jgi:hypothetical protein
MTLKELKHLLAAHPAKSVKLHLADGSEVPVHFHITEVGQVHKRFIDCGGKLRDEKHCRLQAWVASDVGHRIDSTKLGRILDAARLAVPDDSLDVEIEYEAALISQYPVLAGATQNGSIVLELGTKHTDCLAKDVCGVPETDAAEESACCSGSGCCS